VVGNRGRRGADLTVGRARGPPARGAFVTTINGRVR